MAMTNTSTFDQIAICKTFIHENFGIDIPNTVIMMGTGLSSIVDEMTDCRSIAYEDIPNFPKSTVESHRGRLSKGRLGDREILVLAGRWHYYEGYTAKEITFPIRVMKALGVENVIFTNVSGGVNEAYNAGDLVLITDHINTIPDHPLRGENDERLGPRFPDMMKTYDNALRNTIKKCAERMHIKISEGVYYALQGPSLETPAEYVMIHKLGADMVGMSTVPEVIVAKHAGLKIAAVSIISNVCYPPERITETTVEEVIEVANKASNKLNRLLKEVVGRMVMVDKD